MICPTCKGGKTLLKKVKGKGCYEVVLGICDRCHGTGEVEMTNEEWLCSLSTKEKAKRIVNIAVNSDCDIATIVEWLKEIHE